MKKILASLAALAILTVPFAADAQAAKNGVAPGNIRLTSRQGTATNTSKSFSPVKTSSHNSKSNFSNSSRSGMSNRSSSGRYSNYHLTHGTKFEHGTFYRGRNHSHWSSHRYDSRYGCECYYDTGTSCWYYWCQPVSCYYPVSYCPYSTYCWSTPVQPVVEQPCTTCTSYTEPVSVQVKTITRRVYATTTVNSRYLPAVSQGCTDCATGGSYGGVQNGSTGTEIVPNSPPPLISTAGPQGSTRPSIPAPGAEQ